MTSSIFITLPVADPAAARAFYEAIGFTRDPRFPEGTAECVALNDKVSVMLGSKEQFAQISPRPYVEPKDGCNVLLSMNCDSREAVDDMVKNAIAAGGAQAHDPEDHGFMYQWAFEDLDGNGWGLTWMAPRAAQ